MASVKPNYNKNGEIISYRFRACLGRDEITGKQIMPTKTVEPPVGLNPAKALRQMQAEADKWETNLKKGLVPMKKQTFKHFIETEFIPVYVCGMNIYGKEHSASTRVFYKTFCNQLVERFGKMDLDSITACDIDRYLIDLASEKSPSTVNHAKTVLGIIFTFAKRKKKIEHNPMEDVTPIKREQKQVDFLSEDDRKKFLKALDEFAPLYWKTAMYTLIKVGLRRGELSALQWSDIDFNTCTVSVTKDCVNNAETGRKNVIKDTKTFSSNRILPITSSVVQLLKEWQKEQVTQYGTMLMPSAFVFGSPADPYNPIRPDSITQWLSRFTVKHGLRKFSPHLLRHTCASGLLANGASVKEVQCMLGHAKADTTLNYYCGTDMDSLRSASERLEQAFAIGE